MVGSLKTKTKTQKRYNWFQGMFGKIFKSPFCEVILLYLALYCSDKIMYSWGYGWRLLVSDLSYGHSFGGFLGVVVGCMIQWILLICIKLVCVVFIAGAFKALFLWILHPIVFR